MFIFHIVARAYKRLQNLKIKKSLNRKWIAFIQSQKIIWLLHPAGLAATQRRDSRGRQEAGNVIG